MKVCVILFLIQWVILFQHLRLVWILVDNLKFFVSDLNEQYTAAVILKNVLRCCAPGRNAPVGVIAPPSVTDYLSFPAPAGDADLGARPGEPDNLEEYVFV